MKPLARLTLRVVGLSLSTGLLPVEAAQENPNIVLVFMDNFGWGEPGFNGGGIIRGAPTPRLDRLAAEGLRLTNSQEGAALQAGLPSAHRWGSHEHGDRLPEAPGGQREAVLSVSTVHRDPLPDATAS